MQGFCWPGPYLGLGVEHGEDFLQEVLEAGFHMNGRVCQIVELRVKLTLGDVDAGFQIRDGIGVSCSHWDTQECEFAYPLQWCISDGDQGQRSSGLVKGLYF